MSWLGWVVLIVAASALQVFFWYWQGSLIARRVNLEAIDKRLEALEAVPEDIRAIRVMLQRRGYDDSGI